ncbi:MAG: SPOR domain-containing protein [Porticoccaceae bacterium]
MTVLGGCSSAPTPIKVAPNGEYIGWHCEGDISSDEHWRCDKKTLKNGVLVTTATAVEAMPEASVIEADPNPAPAAVSAPVAVPETASAPAPKALEVEPESAPSKQPAPSVDSNSGYSIQLGAFDSPEQARARAAELGLEGNSQIRRIVSGGRVFNVVLLGQYVSRSEAEAAAEMLGIDYWVRSLRSLADATVE